MVKETNNTSHPKAVNIIRPTHSLSVKRSTQIIPPSFTIIPNKARVPRSAKVNVEDSHSKKKTQLNTYHSLPKRLGSQNPAILSDAQRQQQQQKLRSNVITPTVSTITGNSKPSFEVYKPSIKQTLPRSRTTPVMPSATLSTPISVSDNIYRQEQQHHHPQQQHQQRQQHHQKRSISQKISTITAQSPSTLARSITHHSLAISATSSPYIDNSSCTSSSSEDDFEYEYSEMKIGKNQSVSRSDADTLVTSHRIASESKKEKNTSSSDEDEEGDGEDSVINEARVNRKIADLEISNRSLLAVNEMLETTVRRQALQMAKLKQQMAQDGPTGIKPLPPPIEQNEVDSDEEWEKDNMFHRIRQLTEKMIKSGEASLQYECKRLGGRVIFHYKQMKEEDNDNAEEEHKEAESEDDGDALSQDVQVMKLSEEEYSSRTHTRGINSSRRCVY